MTHRRNPLKLEERKAKTYALKHSINKTTTKLNEPDTWQKIYVGTADELRGSVLAEVKEHREVVVPEIPQGLVIRDSFGLGFFDVNF